MFRATWEGKTVGEHRVVFRTDGGRVTVDTRVDITVKAMVFTVFRLKHFAREVWRAGRLESLTSETEQDDERWMVSGEAVETGFRIVGEDGPYLAPPHLLTTNSLWDSRIVREARLIDVQHGGEVGLVARLLGTERVTTPYGERRATRIQIITPHYAGSVFYDDDQRWIKALVELKGETLEYALAS
ncbi:DUF6134 family protein [Thalassobaculum sp.]|uniref:DUF6134 family protein n=1 Tax=Thalassobaculum sp. TaxID=2022740 RepID=UPI0032ED3F99